MASAAIARSQSRESELSRPASPLAPDQRLYKPLPKRSRLSTDAPALDGGQVPTWVPGKGIATSDDDHPALDTATSSTENDIEGPPTPPVNANDPLVHSIFSSVHALVKDAAAATTLFSGAAAELDVLPAGNASQRAGKGGDDGDERDGRDPDYDQHPEAHVPSGQFARLAAAAGLLLDDDDPRDDEFGIDDRRGEDEYGFRRGAGGNKKKRKVPGATDTHAFGSPPGSPSDLPAPASIHGVGGLGREGETGLRANFATAMVGVVKAIGSLTNSRGAGPGSRTGRIPYSSYKRRRLGQPAKPPRRRRPLPQVAPYKPFSPPVPKSGKKASKAAAIAKFAKEPEIALPNLYDPALGPAKPPSSALVTSPRKGKQADANRGPPPPATAKAAAKAARASLFVLPSADFDFECLPSTAITARLAELDRERVKLKRARELILERARELETVRQQAIDDEVRGGGKRSLPDGVGGGNGTSGALTKSSNAPAAGKTYVDIGMQTDGCAPGGRELFVVPRTPAPVGGTRKAPPSRKGKKKRAAHANANNVHHRDNYVPSRPVRTASGPTPASGGATGGGGSRANTAVPMLRAGASLDLVDPNSPFYVAGPDSHPQLGTSDLAPFFAGVDEWLCTFCESKILYGSSANVTEAVRKRKGVLKVRKRAQERAAKAASGQAGKEKAAKASSAAAKRAAREAQTSDVAVGPDVEEEDV